MTATSNDSIAPEIPRFAGPEVPELLRGKLGPTEKYTEGGGIATSMSAGLYRWSHSVKAVQLQQFDHLQRSPKVDADLWHALFDRTAAKEI